MGFLYCDKRTGNLILNYTDTNGKRVRKSSETDNRKTAEMMLRRLEADLDKARALGMSSASQVQGVRFRKFVKEEYLPHVAPPTHAEETYLEEVRKADVLCEAFGDAYLSSVTGGDVERYLDRLNAKGFDRGHGSRKYSTSTINRYRAFLSAVFSKAVRCGYVRDNPVAKTEKRAEAEERVRYLSDHEERRLLSACGGWLNPMVRFALATGMRQGEIRNLTWAQIDRQTLKIHVTNTKSGRDRFIKLGAAAEAALSDVAPVVEDGKAVPWIFPNPKRSGPFTKSTIGKAFTKATEAAGLEGFRFHDLRHDFGTKTLRACGNIRVVQKLLGHASVVTTTRYSHAVDEDMDAAIDARDSSKSVNVVSTKAKSEAAG